MVGETATVVDDTHPTGMHSYKNNHRSEGIRIANARTKMIIFCKSGPINWQLGDLYPIHLVGIIV